MRTAAGVVNELGEAGHDIGQLLFAAMDSCLKTVEGVSDATWGDIAIGVWSTRDVVNHVTYEALWATELFQGATILDVGDRFEGDVVGDDPKRAFEDSVAAAKTVISQPGAVDRTTNLSVGPTPGSEYAMQLFQDFLIHGWDIATGSGQDKTLDATLVEACLPQAELTRELVAEGGAFGNNIDIPADADAQTRLLGLLGRTVSSDSQPPRERTVLRRWAGIFRRS